MKMVIYICNVCYQNNNENDYQNIRDVSNAGHSFILTHNIPATQDDK